ncbi:MAG: nuclear transport factor 2 family protein [Pirellulales bacterium]
MRATLSIRALLALSAFVFVTSFTASLATADQAADEAAIRANAAKYVEAYNRRDSKAMAAMWSPDAVYADTTTGEAAVGRDAIAKQLDHGFAGAEDAKLKVEIDSIAFVSPNVAIEKGTAEVTYGKSPTETTEYSAVHVRRDGKWLLDRVTETETAEEPAKPDPPPSNYEHLKELEWMIGAWIDQDEAATIETDCEWTKNRNFMTRSFAMVIGDDVNKSGMQVVGWDAAAKQIRSWVFDSDGSFSEGSWTKKGDDKWIIHQHGVLPDGGKTTATNILKRLDDNSFTWQSIDREVDGEMLPNIPEVQVIRKPAE